MKSSFDFTVDSNIHQEAIKDPKTNQSSWVYNVIDEYKHLSTQEIKDNLKAISFPYAVLFENWVNDFNISSGIRNANAFGAREVFYIGNKRFDRRGMNGVHNYTELNFIENKDQLMSLKTKYKFVCCDNIPGAQPLINYKWEQNTLIVFGSEGVGVTPMMQKLCDDTVYIEQFGSVRSINVAAASAIMMNDFITHCRK
jgi:tRNA G18 (ribose-2'-O)-methylase SpoU